MMRVTRNPASQMQTEIMNSKDGEQSGIHGYADHFFGQTKKREIISY